MNNIKDESTVASASKITAKNQPPCAVIGPRIQIKGELYGEEDVLIEGVVEGKIEVKDNTMTVALDGRVKANVAAREIIVDGEVSGDLYADERVIIKATSNVRGNLVAPQISLADGARFKGSVDMDASEEARARIMGERVGKK